MNTLIIYWIFYQTTTVQNLNFHVAFGVREKYDNGNGNFISCFSQIIPPTAANDAVIMPHPPQIKQKTC